MYLIRCDFHLKDAKSFSHGDSLKAEVTTIALWEAAKLIETHEQEGGDGEGKDGADVPEMGNYFISARFLEE